jgi:hypothetical protein
VAGTNSVPFDARVFRIRRRMGSGGWATTGMARLYSK